MRLIDANKELRQMIELDWCENRLELRQKFLNINRSQQPINPLQEVLEGIQELKESPWFNEDKETNRAVYNARKEAVEIIEMLCVKEVMRKYETN